MACWQISIELASTLGALEVCKVAHTRDIPALYFQTNLTIRTGMISVRDWMETNH
jgi:hypothetical protein